MCVIEDEMDMVTVETDSEDPALFTLASLLTGLLGEWTLCGTRADWQGLAGDRAGPEQRARYGPRVRGGAQDIG